MVFVPIVRRHRPLFRHYSSIANNGIEALFTGGIAEYGIRGFFDISERLVIAGKEMKLGRRELRAELIDQFAAAVPVPSQEDDPLGVMFRQFSDNISANASSSWKN